MVIPAGLLFVALTDWRKLADAGLVLKGAGLFLLGLTPYLYLPIRAAMNPPMNEADPSTWSNFWYFVKGGGHHKNSFAFGPSEIPERLVLYWDYLVADFNPALLAVAIVGAVFLILRDFAAAAMVLPAYLLWTFHAIEYKIFDVELYFIPSFLALSLLIAVGSGVFSAGGGESFGGITSRRTQGHRGGGLRRAVTLTALWGVEHVPGERHE